VNLSLTKSRSTPRETRESVVRAVAASRLFRGLEPALIEHFAAYASITHLQQGERVWRRGEPARHFYVVLRGVLELQRRAAGADSSLIALFGPGESPAIPVALEQLPFIADSHASTRELKVLRVDASPILAELPTNLALVAAMNRALLEHCRLIHSKIDVLAAGSVRSRLAAFFLDLAARFGDEHEDGLLYVPVTLSRHQVATYVGARVETVIRCCSAWQKTGLLGTTRDGFVISSVDAMQRILEGLDEHPGRPRGHLAERVTRTGASVFLPRDSACY